MVETEVRRRLAAILAADMVGYSRLMGSDEAGTVARQKAHRKELIDPAIAAHHGRIVKTTGDGLLIEFASAVDAVRCAVEIQRTMVDREADVPDDRRIAYRAGINIGDIIIDGDDILGDGVNVAARIEGLAAPGGICLSDDAYRQVRDKLDHAFDDAGEQELKNIARPVRVWRWVADGRATASAAEAVVPLPLPDKHSIAVLPFDNMSGDAEDEYFADGMTEDIITELSRFSQLFVIARNTSMAFKGQNIDVRDVARQLSVHFVLEGSVRKSADQVRITAQLIDGRSGSHLWAERYDSRLEDVFKLQMEVTAQVVGSIVPEIREVEFDRVGRGERLFDEASDLAWQAGHLVSAAIGRGDSSMMDRALVLADRARRINADCLLAYVYICQGCYLRQLYQWAGDVAANRSLAEDAAREMMARAPRDYHSYFSRGGVAMMSDRLDAGLADLRRAFELNPNDAMLLFVLAFAEASAGDTAAAKQHAQRGLRLSPRDRYIGTAHLALAMAALIEHDIMTCRHWTELAIQSHPTAPIRRALMIACAAEASDEAVVHEHLDFLNSFAPNFIPSLFRGENPVFRQPDHMRSFLDSLRKAGLSG